MMRVRRIVSVVIALVLISVFALPIAEAQQATATPAPSGMPVMCDSALVLLVGLAEKDFSYMPPSGLGPFEWGQFTSMFGGSSLMIATQEPGAMSTQEPAASSSAMSTAEATMTITLQAPVVLGEDPQCTQLRQDVVQFVTNHEMMSSGTSMNSTSSSSSSSGSSSMTTETPSSTSGTMSTELPGAPMATASASG